MDKTICELFAGVGGFRLGFEKANSGWKNSLVLTVGTRSTNSMGESMLC